MSIRDFLSALSTLLADGFRSVKTKIAGNKVKLSNQAAATRTAANIPNSLIGFIAAPKDKPINAAIVVILVRVIGNHVLFRAASTASSAVAALSLDRACNCLLYTSDAADD